MINISFTIKRRIIIFQIVLPLFLLAGPAGIPVTADAQNRNTAAGAAHGYIGDMRTIKTDRDDTLIHLARDHNLGFVEIRAANPEVDPWLPGPDKTITLPTRHLLPDAPRKGIVINLAEMRLYHYRDGRGKPKSYPIGIGRSGLATPTGTTKIVSKTARPEWRPTSRMREQDPDLPKVVRPGPENPLGTHALYLGWRAYLIHGTNRVYGIGRRVSSGCIRLYPEDIVKLYRNTDTGTSVHVVKQAVKLAWIDDTLYMEAHTPHDKAVEMEKSGELATYELSDENMQRIIKIAGDASAQLDWSRIRRAVRKRRGYPVPIARRKHTDKADAQNKQAEDSLKAETRLP